MEQARPGGGSWEPPPGAPNSISRPTAGRQPPPTQSQCLEGVLRSQVVATFWIPLFAPCDLLEGRRIGPIATGPGSPGPGPTDRGLLEGSQFPMPVAPVAAPEFVASIFPRPVLGKIMVNFKILGRRS